MNKRHPNSDKSALLLLLFTTFFKVALFVIGGGLAMIPVIEDTFVRRKKLLSNTDILDMITITQTMPGLIAVNSALFVGHRLAGWLGAIVAVLGVILPSVVIITVIAMCWPLLDIQNPHVLKAFSCVRACITAVFLGIACRLGKKLFQSRADYLIIGLFVIALGWGISPVTLILISIPVGWGYILCQKRLIFGEKHD